MLTVEQSGGIKDGVAEANCLDAFRAMVHRKSVEALVAERDRARVELSVAALDLAQVRGERDDARAAGDLARRGLQKVTVERDEARREIARLNEVMRAAQWKPEFPDATGTKSRFPALEEDPEEPSLMVKMGLLCGWEKEKKPRMDTNEHELGALPGAVREGAYQEREAMVVSLTGAVRELKGELAGVRVKNGELMEELEKVRGEAELSRAGWEGVLVAAKKEHGRLWERVLALCGAVDEAHQTWEVWVGGTIPDEAVRLMMGRVKGLADGIRNAEGKREVNHEGHEGHEGREE